MSILDRFFAFLKRGDHISEKLQGEQEEAGRDDSQDQIFGHINPFDVDNAPLEVIPDHGQPRTAQNPQQTTFLDRSRKRLQRPVAFRVNRSMLTWRPRCRTQVVARKVSQSRPYSLNWTIQMGNGMSKARARMEVLMDTVMNKRIRPARTARAVFSPLNSRPGRLRHDLDV